MTNDDVQMQIKSINKTKNQRKLSKLKIIMNYYIQVLPRTNKLLEKVEIDIVSFYDSILLLLFLLFTSPDVKLFYEKKFI